MAKKTIIFFIVGVLISFGLAAWQYFEAPEGILLYTPAPNAQPNYTPSSVVGFIVGTLALSVFSGLVTVFAFAFGALSNRQLLLLGKQASFLLATFLTLFLIALATQNLWP